MRKGVGRPAALKVRIGELWLEGFEPGDRFRIARAVEQELTRLLRARAPIGAFEEPRAVARASGGAFSFRADDPPQRIGAEIARATFRGLTGGRGRDGKG
jgi:hypothetical protein